jgi:haloacetate dehalogenase
MDHPDAVSHLVIMDGLPVVEHLERTDATFARAWWHWWFLGQTDKPAERVICADPTEWYKIPGPETIAGEIMPISGRPCTTRRSCTGCARTTAPA